MKMTLNDTVELMLSPKYQDRFYAEFHQLRIRCESLEKILKKDAAGELDFKLTDAALLREQLRAMRAYLEILDFRAIQENIGLSENEYPIRLGLLRQM